MEQMTLASSVYEKEDLQALGLHVSSSSLPPMTRLL